MLELISELPKRKRKVDDFERAPTCDAKLKPQNLLRVLIYTCLFRNVGFYELVELGVHFERF